MKDLTKIYIDLSKCSEEQRKHIFSLLPKDDYKLDMQIVKNYKHLHLCKIGWFVDVKPASKTELTYPEFIKLFEGGEDNNGWIKIESEADLPKENAEYYWTVTENDKNIKERWFNKFFNQYEGEGRVTHYQPIVKPEPPKF